MTQQARRKEDTPLSRLQRLVDRINVADLAGQSKEDFWAFAYETGTGVIQGLIEEVLEVEMDDFVGARWHERGRDARRTTRAGYRPRRLTVLGGDVALRMPRARIGGFRSAFLTFRGRREQAFDEAVVRAYVAGASMRETTAFLQRLADDGEQAREADGRATRSVSPPPPG